MKLPNFPPKILLFGSAELLYVNGVLHLQALQNRGFVKLLTTTQLFHNTSFLKLSLELLEGLLNVFAFFYRYNNHCFFVLNFKLLDIKSTRIRIAHTKCGCKITTYLPNNQVFNRFLLKKSDPKATFSLCRHLDSNQGPPPCQGDTLTS